MTKVQNRNKFGICSLVFLLFFGLVFIISKNEALRGSIQKRTLTQNKNNVEITAQAIGIKNSDTQAPSLSEIPNEHRKNIQLVKKWPDGTLIYRTQSEQITVMPDGKILFLPDQI
jgi:uncharacterized protein YcfL